MLPRDDPEVIAQSDPGSPRSRVETRKLPSLDGLRAVAIVLVCLGHLSWNQRYSGRVGQFLKLGDLGVRIFFVLSGFLITRLLLRELEHTSTPSLKRFYFRRTMRIFPAFYAFVGIMVVANALHWGHLFHGPVAPSLTYSADFLVPGKRVFGHTWSLAVEEQFYLLWPAALLLFGPRRGLWLLAGVLVVCPLMRVASFEFVTMHAEIASRIQNLQFRFDTQADSLAFGCLLCVFRDMLHGHERYRRLLASRAFVLIPLLGLTTAVVGRHQTQFLLLVYLLIGCTAINAAVALTLDWCLTYPRGIIGRFLNTPPVTAVGVMSYSIYLWQEPFIYVGRSAWWQTPPINIGFTLLAAALSYVLLERPCLRLRTTWERQLFKSERVDGRLARIGVGMPLMATHREVSTRPT